MPGRKCDPIWQHFDKLSSVSGKGCKARCKLCRKEMQGLVERMKAHWDKCSAGNGPVPVLPFYAVLVL